MSIVKYHIDNYLETGDEKSLLVLVNRIKKMTKTKIDKFGFKSSDWLFEDIVGECVCHFLEDIKTKENNNLYYDYYWKLETKVLSLFLELNYQINLNHSTVRKLYLDLIKIKYLTMKDIGRIKKTTSVSEEVIVIIHNIIRGNNISLDSDTYDEYDSYDDEYYDGNEIGNTYYEPFNVICRKDVDNLVINVVKYLKSKKKGSLSLYSIAYEKMTIKDRVKMCGVSYERLRQIIANELYKFKKKFCIDKRNYIW